MKFNEALKTANFAVLEQHPHLGFYEASAMLIPADGNCDGTIEVDTFKAVYTNFENGTYVATIANGEVNIEFIDEPWLEDIVMCPYVPMDVDFALELLEKDGKPFNDGGVVVLRHQLYPGEAEPRYFFGPAATCNTVGVYTGKVNVPLA